MKKDLKIIQVGNRPDSNKYIKNKIQKCIENNITVTYQNVDMCHLKYVIDCTPKGTSIIVQKPLPENDLYSDDFISLEKDIDGLSSRAIGKVVKGDNIYAPCTALGIFNNLKKKYAKNLKDKRITIAGRSDLVGKPLAIMLINEGCTVNIFGSNEKYPQKYLQLCDIFISAIGIPEHWSHSDFDDSICEYIIDVGINQKENDDGSFSTCGDVQKDIGHNIEQTPVPGGVGKWTVDTLIQKLKGEEL